MLLFLVRHGQSEFNLLGEEAGSDSPLTELGLQQAERVGAWLAQRGPFDAMYCSPLQRARQTSEVIGRHTKGPAPDILGDLALQHLAVIPIAQEFAVLHHDFAA